jgi:regulator of replication initiation timing
MILLGNILTIALVVVFLLIGFCALASQLAEERAKSEELRLEGLGLHEAGCELNDQVESLQQRIGELEAEVLKWKQQSFRPLGDNHHNALACPYCNPGGAGLLAANETLQAENSRLRGLLERWRKDAYGFTDTAVLADTEVVLGIEVPLAEPKLGNTNPESTGTPETQSDSP